MVRYSTTYSSTRVYFSAYHMMKIKGSDVLDVLRHPENRIPSREVAVKLFAPKRSSLHDAPRQRFAPNFCHDGVTSVLPSSSCSLEPPSTARRFSGTVSKPAFFLKRQRISSEKKRCSSSPAASARKPSPQTNARHGPKHGQARR